MGSRLLLTALLCSVRKPTEDCQHPLVEWLCPSSGGVPGTLQSVTIHWQDFNPGDSEQTLSSLNCDLLRTLKSFPQ